MSSLRRSFD